MRLANTFSKKLDNHVAAISLRFAYCSFYPHPPNAPHHTGHGCWRYGSRLGDYLHSCTVGRCRREGRGHKEAIADERLRRSYNPFGPTLGHRLRHMFAIVRRFCQAFYALILQPLVFWTQWRYSELVVASVGVKQNLQSPFSFLASLPITQLNALLRGNMKIEFHYKKSSLFRVVHSNGAWGGLTPDLDVFVAFFNSRPPIPETVVHELSEEGVVGPEVPELKVSKNGIVREVEVGVIMKPEDVRNLITFLQDRLDNIKKINDIASQRTESQEQKKQ